MADRSTVYQTYLEVITKGAPAARVVQSYLEVISPSLEIEPATGGGRHLAAWGLVGYELPPIEDDLLMNSNFRLSLTTATPVTTADVTAAGTLYLTPFTGNRIRLYDGSAWANVPTAEISLSLSGLTTDKNYDIFVFQSGTVQMEAVAWTNDTTRATALVRQDGAWVKTGSLTRLYVGTIRTSAASQCEDSATKRYVWNMYNRQQRRFYRVDTTGSWSYASATWRSANNSTSNRVAWVQGLAEDMIHAAAQCQVDHGGTGTNSYPCVAIGLDSTTVPSGVYLSVNNVAAGQRHWVQGRLDTHPSIGYHYAQWIENCQGVASNFLGEASSVFLSGLTGWMWG